MSLGLGCVDPSPGGHSSSSCQGSGERPAQQGGKFSVPGNLVIVYTHMVLRPWYQKSSQRQHTHGSPPMVPEELTKANFSSALDGAVIFYFDVRLHDTALFVAEEAWTGASSIHVALVSMLSRLPNIKYVIVTLGEKGCLMFGFGFGFNTAWGVSWDLDLDSVLLDSMER